MRQDYSPASKYHGGGERREEGFNHPPGLLSLLSPQGVTVEHWSCAVL